MHARKQRDGSLSCLQTSEKARFITAICGLGMDDKKEDWVPCDPLAFAVAMDETLILAADNIYCKVETQAANERGQTSFAKSNNSESLLGSQCGAMRKVIKADTTKFAQAIDGSTNTEH